MVVVEKTVKVVVRVKVERESINDRDREGCRDSQDGKHS